MNDYPILQPAVALMIWTMIMWAWMYATRIPAMTKAQVDMDQLVRDPSKSLDHTLPANVQWKSHNHNHLHEQPTLFYAVVIVLVLVGAGGPDNALLAWIYTGLRVAHSLVQATANKVMVRFVLYAIASVVLMVMIAKAAIAVF